jgi:sec-independent protein translocase protein TatC
MVTLIGRRGRGSKPKRDPEGRMTLGQHLRELRSRVLWSVLAVLVFGVVGVVYYTQILDVLMGPFVNACKVNELNCELNYDQVISPFTVPLRIGLMTGFVLAAPVWIYQVWAFITPAMYRNEKKWAATVVAVSVPLFLTGILLCYLILPRGLEVLFGFTPGGVSNIIAFNDYFSFVLRLIVFFGIGFLLPVFVVLLNAAGILSREALSNARRWIVVGVFVFAAMANPSGEPITMLSLALPMYLLFEIAILVCRFNDRRRDRAMLRDLDDDQASSLEETATAVDDVAPVEAAAPLDDLMAEADDQAPDPDEDAT